MELDACVCFNLRRAARRVTQIYDRALQSSGLKITQFALLAVLNSGGPLSMRELARTMGTDRTTLTRNLRPLERRRLVRTAPGQDMRTRNISITAKGLRSLERALPLWKAVQSRVRATLGEKTWSGMRQGLNQISERVKAAP